MDEIVTERSGSILRVELNRPAKRNAMTSSMYARSRKSSITRPRTSAHASCSRMAQEIHSPPGNDVEDFLKIPPGRETCPRRS